MKMLSLVAAVACAVAVSAVPPAVNYFEADMKIEQSMMPMPMDSHTYFDAEEQKLRVDTEMWGQKNIDIGDYNASIRYIIDEAFGQSTCRQCYLGDDLYPMAVPIIAYQDGTDTVNGETCDIWRVTWPMLDWEFCTQQSGHYAVLRTVMTMSNAGFTAQTKLTFSNFNFDKPPKGVWETNTTCEKPKCNAPVDIVLLVDGSGSISPSDFVLMKTFARSLVTNFTLSSEAANIALVQFSSTAVKAFDLLYDQAAILHGINTMQQLRGSTNMDAGLVTSRSVFASSKRSVNKVLIMFTDGAPDAGNNPVAVAQTLKDQNVEIYTVGVGSNVNPTLLKKIATEDKNPEQPHYFQAASFAKLMELVSNIVAAGCKGDECASKK